MPLLDAEKAYRHACRLGPAACADCQAMLHGPAEWAPRRHWSAPTRPQDFPNGPPPASFEHHRQGLRVTMAVTLDVHPAITLVNDCRWIAYCPDRACNEAQAASRTDRRFFCTTCLNREAGGHWRPVWWPSDAEIAQVEQVHATRPHIRPDGTEQKCYWWPSNGQGKPHELLDELLKTGRLRQFQLTPAAFGIQAAG